mmetsp:Transcript_46472/g.143437  ORF Transcript_46472/g.143437 Transcript_46472/m.143437 type:complete len:231 (+) Transcript_46472:90-782(+)
MDREISVVAGSGRHTLRRVERGRVVPRARGGSRRYGARKLRGARRRLCRDGAMRARRGGRLGGLGDGAPERGNALMRRAVPRQVEEDQLAPDRGGRDRLGDRREPGVAQAVPGQVQIPQRRGGRLRFLPAAAPPFRTGGRQRAAALLGRRRRPRALHRVSLQRAAQQPLQRLVPDAVGGQVQLLDVRQRVSEGNADVRERRVGAADIVRGEVQSRDAAAAGSLVNGRRLR